MKLDRLAPLQPPRKRSRAAGQQQADEVIDLDDSQNEVIVLGSDDEEHEQARKRKPGPVVVDLCDSDDDTGSASAPVNASGSAASLPLRAPPEEEEDDENIDYDESRDILAAERKGLAAWAEDEFAKCELVSRITGIQMNPYSYPGENLFEAFVAGYKLARNTKRIELKFHGTPEVNVDSICENGLDPSKRSGQVYGEGEYFGGCVADSLAYCRGGRKMIVFAVLMDGSGLTFHGEGGAHKEVTVINKSHHHVPIAVISFCYPQATAAAHAAQAAAFAATQQNTMVGYMGHVGPSANSGQHLGSSMAQAARHLAAVAAAYSYPLHRPKKKKK